EGKIVQEAGPMPPPPPTRNRPPVVDENLMDHGKANTGPFASRFGREERVVDVLHDVGRHALTRIPHGQLDMWTEVEGGMLHGQRGIDLNRLQAYLEEPSGLAHSVLGIRTQVNDDLVELGGISKHSPYLGINMLANLNTGGE